MTDAPETIGLLYDGLGHYALATIEEKDSCILFRRADLPATDAQAMQNERVKTLVGALEKISKTYKCDESRLIHSDIQIADIARAALLAIKEGQNDV